MNSIIRFLHYLMKDFKIQFQGILLISVIDEISYLTIIYFMTTVFTFVKTLPEPRY